MISHYILLLLQLSILFCWRTRQTASKDAFATATDFDGLRQLVERDIHGTKEPRNDIKRHQRELGSIDNLHASVTKPLACAKCYMAECIQQVQVTMYRLYFLLTADCCCPEWHSAQRPISSYKAAFPKFLHLWTWLSVAADISHAFHGQVHCYSSDFLVLWYICIKTKRCFHCKVPSVNHANEWHILVTAYLF